MSKTRTYLVCTSSSVIENTDVWLVWSLLFIVLNDNWQWTEVATEADGNDNFTDFDVKPEY